MALVIKKKVSLEFLGDDYSEAYLVFKAIPALDYIDIQKDIEGIKEDESKSLNYLIEILQKYFISGQFPNDEGELEEVSKEDLPQLDPYSLTTIFQRFTGQDPDPKAETPLTSSSLTAEQPQ